MPYKAKKPCAYPGCPKLTDRRYCEEHEKNASRHYERYGRDPEHDQNYGAAWRKIRSAFLEDHPLCEICEADGKLTPATLVHHERKLRDSGSNDYENLQSLCQECHSRLHGQKGDRWGSPSG